MALFVHWYDFPCFAIVAGAIICSVVIISESKVDWSKNESLLIVGLSTDRAVAAAASQCGYVGWDQLLTSCWRGVHPKCLFCTRLVSFVAMVGILVWDIRTFGWGNFIYYTEWTFTLVIIYFAISTLISAYGCWIYSKHVTRSDKANGFTRWDDEENIPATLTFRANTIRDAVKYQNRWEKEAHDDRAGFSGYVMQIVYQTSAGAVMLTDIVFWCLIAPFLSIAHFKLNTIMCCMHTLNAVFLLLDTVLNNLPFPWLRIAYFVLWSCIYVIFQWVLHACGFSWWPYPFLVLASPWAPLWYFCLAFLHIPCYSLFCLIVKAKDSVFPKLFPNGFVGWF